MSQNPVQLNKIQPEDVVWPQTECMFVNSQRMCVRKTRLELCIKNTQMSLILVASKPSPRQPSIILKYLQNHSSSVL